MRSLKLETRVATEVSVKTKLLVVTFMVLVASVGMMAVFKLVSKDEITSQLSNQVSGQIKDIISGQSLSGVTVTFTNVYNSSEIYSTVTDTNGNYQLSLGGVGQYSFYADIGTDQYYDYNEFELPINNFPFVYNAGLLSYTPYDMESNWDCNSEFDIATGTFPLIDYIDRYFALIDIYLNTGQLSQVQWDELINLKFGANNSISSELAYINNHLSDPLYINNNYASILFDKFLCNYRKEGAFYYSLDFYSWPSNYPESLVPYIFITTRYNGYPVDTALLSTAKNMATTNPVQVSQELLDNQIIEKIASVLDYQLEHSAELNKINPRFSYSFWNDYGGHIVQDNNPIQIAEALYPNTQRRSFIFYTEGIESTFNLLINLATYQDKQTIVDLYKQNSIFEKIYKLMVLPSLHDSAIPAYRTHVISGTYNLFNVLYPYTFKNDYVQKIIDWTNENKNVNSFFWTYIASPKVFGYQEENLIGLSNLFNDFCISTSTTILNGSCSPIEPLYCNNGLIVNNCRQCGCPNGLICDLNGSCGTDLVPNITQE